MPLRVVIWIGHDGPPLGEALAPFGAQIRVAADRTAALAALADADVLIALAQNWDADCAAALAASPVRWVQFLNAGIDSVTRFGLPSRMTVTTFGGAGAFIVAEHALQLLLAVLRRTPLLLDAQRRGEWAPFPTARAMECLHGQRVAVLGAGHIGRAIARLVQAFGAQPIGVARAARRDPGGFDVVALDRLAEVLPSCGAVVVALPLEAATDRLLDAAMLARLPRGAVLVNVSRGRIVVTDALVAALRSGALAGAGLDVTDPEPLPQDHPLWRLPNVIVTPHVAWAGAVEERRRAVEAVVLENLARYIAGRPLEHVFQAASD
ncbi:MAG TPA: D-2-hydroxyacid dehydrogenase [Gammaproteobacteria bacterium]|nr:D-2-hydroxyacid dehydrogenase [Gammaproteobacteria bacterium]